jgi:hypothetical protein
MFARMSVLFAFSFVFAGQALAATMPTPTVEYSAERVIESPAGAITGKVFSAKGKERTETNIGGMQSVLIIRQDQQVGWMLLPAQKMYQTLDFAQVQQMQPGAAPADKVTFTQLASETVDGFRTTKYQMVMKDGTAEGYFWITDQGIPVKMEMTTRATNSKSAPAQAAIKMTLRNLKVGRQDPALFELPAGYAAMPGAKPSATRPTSALPRKESGKPGSNSLSMNSALRDSLQSIGSL